MVFFAEKYRGFLTYLLDKDLVSDCSVESSLYLESICKRRQRISIS